MATPTLIPNPQAPTSISTHHAGRGRRAALAALAVFAVLATGCRSSQEPATSALPAPATSASATPTPTSTPVPDPEPAVVARARAEVAIHEAPDAASPQTVLDAATSFGTPTVLLATGEPTDDGWLEVLLPVRPNGATGWVRTDEVDLREVDLAVEVDLDARELVVVDGGEPLLTTATAIGDADHPTPTGRFYVTDLLETPDPGGAYGPYAIGLSGHSDVLTQFAGGDGQIGIHGTNAPDSIGRDVSHGCLRVANDVITRLAHLLPLGTPVTIS